MTRTVGVVVPAYRPDVDALAAYVAALDDRLEPTAIRIELDDSTASTDRALERVHLPETVSVAAAPQRRGKGAAITAGFDALEADVLAFADADGSTPADSIADVVDPVWNGRVDLAVGSRRHPDARVKRHQTFVRRRLGDGFAWIARRLLGVSLSDYQCGGKAIDREAWTAVRGYLRERGFGWDVELVATADALGYRLTDVPVTWEDAPRSTVSTTGTTLTLARALFDSWYRTRRLRESPTRAAIEASLLRSSALDDGDTRQNDVDAPAGSDAADD